MDSALKSEEAITARVKEAEELWERIKIALEIPEGQQALESACLKLGTQGILTLRT